MQEGRFVLKSPFKPQGDQPQAIEALTQGVQSGMPCQVLLGVTGSGKTYTMASVIERSAAPTLVIAHNKTLAAQLCAEFREFFPDSAVEYFVSYYDYYQPEAYIASTDTYIEKDSAVNEEIERLRHSATAALREPAGCDRRRFGLVHLFHGRSLRIRGHDDLPPPRHGDGARRAGAPVGRNSIRPKRHRV